MERIFLAAATLALLLGFGAADCRAGTLAEAKTMNVDVPKFINAYNEYAGPLNIAPLPRRPTQSDVNAKAAVYIHNSEHNLGVEVHLRGKEKNPILMIFFGTGDGTQQSGKNIVLGATSFIAALTPDLDNNSRGEGMRNLGILPFALADGKTRSWISGGLKFSAEYSRDAGLLIFAEAE